MVAIPYRLTGRIETGDFADLYQAVRGEAQPVVIKLLHARTSDVVYARDLAATGRLLTRLSHPGIAQVIDLGWCSDRLAVIRESVDGFTLGTALQRLTTREVLLPPPVALVVVLDLLDIVQKAHEAGVIHGALTPGNVLLSRDGMPAICDFGVLRALANTPSLKKAVARGRSAYRGPEVAQGELPGPESDVFSIAAIAYELMTLREPSSVRPSVSVRHDQVPAPPSRLDRRINPRLDPIVMKALDGNPLRRYRSCEELADALREALAESKEELPSRDELRRFVDELFPREVNLEALGPVPFSSPFFLGEITDAGVSSTGERVLTLDIRRPFSGGAGPELDRLTGSIVPPQKDFAGDDGSGPGRAPPVSPDGSGRGAVDDGSGPGTAPPSTAGWHAPPGAAPQKARPQAAAVAVNRRMKVTEGFANPLRAGDLDDGVQPEALLATQEFQTGPAFHVPRASDTRADVPGVTSGPATFVDVPAPWRRGLIERRRVQMIAVGVAFVCAFCLALLVLKLTAEPPPSAQVARVPDFTLLSPPAPVAAPAPEPEPPGGWHVPGKRTASALLTVTSDVPAHVYVDGQRVRKPTPLKDYPVAAGQRTLGLVDIATGEKHEFNVNLIKGQSRKIADQFTPPAGRRR